ncbi:PhoD-like phosphatase [Nitzschia inconspicua]|uniref:PhoD-like phosphatase n=1 Tax=Nitzschia inconspicua TaxID=303405 RepID=A0A9K3LWD0_9STRA|nr:PhoD-like phosphatase [Nitzschia inconspicua]
MEAEPTTEQDPHKPYLECQRNEERTMPHSPSRIIFGSCSSQHFEQPFWDVIQRRDPTAFVWAGDAVYADDRRDENGSILDGTPDYLRMLYQQQHHVPGYQALVRSGVSIFGTMDDHDYGTNNGDYTFPWKRENGMEFVSFLGLKETTSAMARRVSHGKGVYGVQVYDFGTDPKQTRLLSDNEAGLDPDVVSTEEWKKRKENVPERRQVVAVFVLDVRTNKTPWTKQIPERYSKYPDGDYLGEEQWTWFEEAIGRSDAAVNIIVSGVQVHAPWFYDGNLVENWSVFPKAQHRLYQAILQPNVRAPLLVTGDIHLAQLLRKDCNKLQQSSSHATTLESGTRVLYEITTSGMTHSWGSTDTSVCGRPNMSRLCRFYPYNALFSGIVTFAHWTSPWTALLKDTRTNMPQYSLARNIAEVEMDWEQNTIIVRLVGTEGQILLRQQWNMDDLSGSHGETDSMMLLSAKSFEIARNRLEWDINATVSDDEFICVNYRGNPDPIQFAFSVLSVVTFAMLSSIYPLFVCVGLIIACRRRRPWSNSVRTKRKKN